jgi:hypothetical protein
MPLESLLGPLEMLGALRAAEPEEEWIDARNLGLAVTQAFVVDLRSRLSSPSVSTVELESVGVLTRHGTQLEFRASERLKSDSDENNPNPLLLDFMLKRSDFLSGSVLKEYPVWGAETLETLFGKRRDKLLPGQAMISGFWTLIVNARLAMDPGLSKTLEVLKPASKELRNELQFAFDATCLLLHDSICCGSGVDLETIGAFRPQPYLDFRIAQELQLLLINQFGARKNSGRSSFAWIR